MKKATIRIALLCFGIFLALILAELLLRAFWHPLKLDPKFKRDDLKWLQGNVVLNRYNYRDRDFSLNKDQGIFRIYALGDSFTFGWYINDGLLTYPKILEKKLREKYGEETVEVINASRHGYSFAEELQRFKNEGVLFRPDLVTVGITAFDLVDIKYPKPLIANQFLRSLFLYKISFGKIDDIRISRATKRAMDNTYRSDSEEMKGIRRQFQGYKQTADTIGANLTLIIFPEYNSSNPDGVYQLAPYHPIITKVAEEFGITVIDLMESFGKYANKRDLILNPIDPHPSALAHQIAAEYIFEKIDFDAIIQNPKSSLETSKLLAGVDTTLPGYMGVISLGNGWTYFDNLNDTVKKTFLPDTNDRKIAYLDNYIETIKAFSGDGWPGAKITYYLPYGGLETRLNKKLFGYNIIGVSRVTVFWREDGALKSEDLGFDNLSIYQNDDEIFLKTTFSKPADHYRLQLDVSSSQINIDGDKIVKFTASKLLEGRISFGENKIFFKAEGDFGSFPRFFVEGENYDYAWVNNQITAVKYTKEGNGFWLEPVQALDYDAVIIVPVAYDITGILLERPVIEFVNQKGDE